MRTIEELRALLSAAEAELEAATTRTDLNAAARKLMRAKEALKFAEKAAGGATRRAAFRGAAKAGAS